MTRQKTIIVSATSDLTTDQRVHKTCMELQHAGYRVVCVGRRLKSSLAITRPYKVVRFRLPAERGIFFYASYQIWLFLYLLTHRADGLWSNDLDTLLPNWLISKVKDIPLAYDSHEYYCGSPEVLYRPLRYKVWKSLENFLLPRLSNILTVNASIARIYSDEYGVNTTYVRNISPLPTDIPKIKRTKLGYTPQDFVLIAQGRGLNVGRGLEELLEAFPLLPTNVKLLIIGSGNALEAILKKIQFLHLHERVKHLQPLPYAEMLGYTRIADAGISLDKTDAPNYLYSLPNKIFDFIHCSIPILGSQAIEVKYLIEHYQIGEIIESHRPEDIASAVNALMQKGKSYYLPGLQKASAELRWEVEVKKLRDFIAKNFSH
ncbi:glycosyltransferase [Thermaurantimonas aggregans]|nr:glycosyltransferase [Thermaurantimonas aggregans]MCX8149483.1 glycosyltransferase [Thermaurantimonas aggregans]